MTLGYYLISLGLCPHLPNEDTKSTHLKGCYKALSPAPSMGYAWGCHGNDARAPVLGIPWVLNTSTHHVVSVLQQPGEAGKDCCYPQFTKEKTCSLESLYNRPKVTQPAGRVSWDSHPRTCLHHVEFSSPRKCWCLLGEEPLLAATGRANTRTQTFGH